MKISVNPALTTAEFVYLQLSSSEATSRFVAQAMTSGVPHVNLALLREFEVVSPPVDLTNTFTALIRPLDAMRSALSRVAMKLCEVRSSLIPKLVTGAIDVSRLDLDALLDEQVA